MRRYFFASGVALTTTPPTGPTYRADTMAHYERATAMGFTGIDLPRVDAAYARREALGLDVQMHNAPCFGYKLSGGRFTAFASIIGGDMTLGGASPGALYTAYAGRVIATLQADSFYFCEQSNTAEAHDVVGYFSGRKDNGGNGGIYCKSVAGGVPGRYGLITDSGATYAIWHDDQARAIGGNITTGAYAVFGQRVRRAANLQELVQWNPAAGQVQVLSSGGINGGFYMDDFTPFWIGGYPDAQGLSPLPGYFYQGTYSELLLLKTYPGAAIDLELFNALQL